MAENSLKRGRAARSDLWNIFTRQNSDVAICNLCKQKLSYKSTTSNLKKHISHRHPTVILQSRESQNSTHKKIRPTHEIVNIPDALIEEHDSQEENLVAVSESPLPQTSINLNPGTSDVINQVNPTSRKSADVINQVNPTSRKSADVINQVNPTSRKSASYQQTLTKFIPKKFTPMDKRLIDKKLLKLFIEDFQPFSIVEDTGFKELVHALNPNYELPSRTYISKTLIPAQYEECRNQVKNALKNGYKFCLTTDCWTSITTESYLALTAHFVTEEFKLVSILLDCSAFPSSHTSLNLAQRIQNIVKEWEIEDKIIMIVSDNAKNIVNAIYDHLEWKHFGCFAHTLNLIIRDALKHNFISKLINKVKVIVAHFKKSYVSSEKLMTFQKNEGKNPLKLINDVVTRWNSTYFMLDRFTDLETAIRSTIAVLNKDLPVLTTEEWKICGELCKVLKPFERVTCTISGDKYCSGSLVIPLSNGLKNICNQLKTRCFETPVMEFVNLIADNLNKPKRMGCYEQNTILSISTFLDPRFKTLTFSDVDIGDDIKHSITTILRANLEQQQYQQTMTIQESRNEKEDSDDDLSVWYTFNEKLSNMEPKNSSRGRAVIEIERYMEEDILQRNEDPLKWWKNRTKLFPLLSGLAREHLCVTGSSVPCERLFSKAGQILTERRTRLKEENLRKLLFLNTNRTSS